MFGQFHRFVFAQIYYICIGISGYIFNTFATEMIAIENTLVSEDLLDKKFVCDLTRCKGACCVEGEAGAPVEEYEVGPMEDALDEVKPFMTEAGKKVVAELGVFVVGHDGELETPLVNGKECAFTNFDEKGVAYCTFEKAFEAKKINFRKPISCHLYPVRVKNYPNYTAVNYHKWQICTPACQLGENLSVKLYRFLKVPLTQKFGQKWYEELEQIDQHLNGID